MWRSSSAKRATLTLTLTPTPSLTLTLTPALALTHLVKVLLREEMAHPFDLVVAELERGRRVDDLSSKV